VKMRGHDADRDALTGLLLEESRKGLAAMQEALARLEHRPNDTDALRALLRLARIVEGHAATLGLKGPAEVLGQVGEILAQLSAGTLAASFQVVDLLRASVDTLREMLVQARG